MLDCLPFRGPSRATWHGSYWMDMIQCLHHSGPLLASLPGLAVHNTGGGEGGRGLGGLLLCMPSGGQRVDTQVTSI